MLRINGAEQLEAHRAFRWLTSAQGVVGPALSLGPFVVMWGAHDAYTSDTSPCRVVRLVAVASDGAVAVRDHAEGAHSGSRVSLQFPPATRISAGDSENEFRIEPGDVDLVLHGAGAWEVVEGQDDPFRGWWSDTYGSWEPAACLVAELEDDAEGGFDISPSGAKPIELGSVVEWLDDRVRLTVTMGDEESKGELLLG